MWTLAGLNALCLVLAAAGWLALRRGGAVGDGEPGFAAVLASARRVADRLAEEEGSAERPPARLQEPEPLPIATRMAAIRLMLQGRSAAEGAAALAVPEEAVRALYRLHGREGEAP